MQQPISLRGGTALLDAAAVLSRLDIKQSYTVADLGCGGNGHFIPSLAASIGPAGKIYALDVQKTVLDSVASKLKLLHIVNVDFIWSDLESYGAAAIPDGSCDIALLINVLFQNKDQAAIVRESARYIRPGGRLAIIEWKPIATPFGPPIETRLSPLKIKELGSAAGLRLFDEFDVGPYHYVETFLKP